MNEAAISAAKAGREYINKEDVDKSYIKVGVGGEKRSHVVSEEDRKITAYHESGHAILFHLLPYVGPVHIVSIIPTGTGAGGYTMPLPQGDQEYLTKAHLLNEIKVSMGGRIAEKIIFGNFTRVLHRISRWPAVMQDPWLRSMECPKILDLSTMRAMIRRRYSSGKILDIPTIQRKDSRRHR